MEEKEITIDNLKIHYKIAGFHPAILILHGWGSSSEKWQKVGEMLAKNEIKVIIPDLPGFGKSQEPSFSFNLDNYCQFIEKFISVLNLKKFYLLGHSFGGAVAVKYALKFPEKIEKLVLIAPALCRRDFLKTKFWGKIAKISKIFSFFPFYSLTRRFFYRFIVKSDYLSVKGVMRESYLKIIKENLSEILSSLSIPALIIWGKRDDVTPLKDAYFINERIKNSKLTIIPEGNHDLEQKFPETLVKKILEN